MQVQPFYQTIIGLLPADKVLIKILSKYLNYADIFLFHLIMGLSENIGINKYTIELTRGK